MALDLTPAQWVNVAANGSMAVGGLVLVAARPRQIAAVLLGLFLATLGAASVSSLVAPSGLAAEGLRLALRSGATVALVWLAVRVPERLHPSERALMGGVCVATAAIYLGARWLDRGSSSASSIDYVGLSVLGSAALFAFVALPLRYARARDATHRLTLALFGAGLCFFASQNAGEVIAPTATLIDVVSTSALLLTSAMWLAATRGPDSHLARNVAIAIPAAMLANTMVAAWSRSPDLEIAAGRFLGIGLLSYAILRGLIAGLDTKVHFAISKGSVAAIFVVVFFVASELAQQFFAQRYSAMAGIVAAGMLVFALAPLQRAAERFAERAVPLDAHPAHGRRPSAQASDVYKAALRAAMRDGIITRREEKHLAEVARGLGLDPVQAHELRDEVEGEPHART